MADRINVFRRFITKSRQYPYNTIIGIASIIAGYIALLLMDYSFNHEYKTVCPFKLITTVPCPGCGMGRASLALLQGNIGQSLYYNILCIPFSIGVSVSIVWLFKDLIGKEETFFAAIRQPIRKRWKYLLFVSLLLTWILNIYHKI